LNYLLTMENITSIFSSWKDYSAALEESLNTEFYGNKYPEYCKLQDNYTSVDLMIITELLKAGHNPQEGLESFADACLNGDRYLPEFKSCLDECLAAFIKHGAHITQGMVDRLFTLTCNKYTFEDEAQFIPARGTMLDAYSEYNIDISKHGDWTMVEAKYWWDIDNDIDRTTMCRMYLKFSSEYLKSL